MIKYDEFMSRFREKYMAVNFAGIYNKNKRRSCSLAADVSKEYKLLYDPGCDVLQPMRKLFEHIRVRMIPVKHTKSNYSIEDMVKLSDEDIQLIYPFRTKNDMNIRRTRFYDLLSFCINDKKLRYVSEILNYSSYDYITTLNFCWASVIFGSTWMHNIIAMGFGTLQFQDLIDHFKTIRE